MENIFKNFLYTGVGVVSYATDKFKSTINDLIKSGKLSSEEGKKIMDDFVNQSEERKIEYESQFKAAVEKTLNSFKFAKSEDVENLKKRVEILEELIAKRKIETDLEKEVEKETKKTKRKPKDDEPRKEEE